MVVGIEAGFFQTVGLIGIEHTECGACLKAKSFNFSYHRNHTFEGFTVWSVAPCSPHAETLSTLLARLDRGRADLFDRKEGYSFKSCLMVCRLRTIVTILWTSTGFDGEKNATLDLFRVMKTTMNCVSSIEEVE
jgi:hypothetical protein